MIYNDIGRLDVAVDDVVAVSFLERGGDILRDFHRAREQHSNPALISSVSVGPVTNSMTMNGFPSSVAP